MRKFLKKIKKKIVFFVINKFLAGTRPCFFSPKRKLLNSFGNEIGYGTKIVGPIYCTGKLKTGQNCWLGKNFTVNGNGMVEIGDNCDIAPEVIFQTGSHFIGDNLRRAGEGFNSSIVIGNGVWIGVRATILNDVVVRDSSVVAACACVTKNVESNLLVGGVPAKTIRKL